MSEFLVADFLIAFYIFMRIIAIFFSAPVLSHSALPPVSKFIISAIMAYIIFFTVNKTNIPLDTNLFVIFFTAAKEFITGYLMGFMLTFIFNAISYAGHFIGYDMGLMFAEVLNPMEETSGNVIGEMIYYSAMMLFLMINGHHYVITAVSSSFGIIPIGKYTLIQPVYDVIIKYSFGVFVLALKIASPLMVSFFLIHMAEGIISRVIPNIQIFFISQPAKIGLGFVMLASLAPIYIYAIKYFLQGYEDQLTQLLKAMSS